MKFKVLDPPIKEEDLKKISCCAYNLFSWAVVDLSVQNRTAKKRKKKARSSVKRDWALKICQNPKN